MDAIRKYTATERLLRNFLAADGWERDSIRIAELDLAAVERPGWVQFFLFVVRARRDVPLVDVDDLEPPVETIHGVLRDDGRGRLEIRLVEDADARERELADWSEKPLRQQRRSTAEEETRWFERMFLTLVVLFVGSLVIALFLALASGGGGNVEEPVDRRSAMDDAHAPISFSKPGTSRSLSIARFAS